MGHWKETIRITSDTDDCYCMIKLSCLSLVHALCNTVIIPDIPILLFWGNSSCMNSDYGEWGKWFIYMRVSMLGLYPWCINLMNQSLSSYNWVCLHLYLTYYLISHFMHVYIYAHNTVFDSCFLIRNYRYTCACLCTLLVTHLTTHWAAFWLSWTFMSRFRSLKRGRLFVDQNCAAVS